MREKNVEFLKNIDPGYFEHMAALHGQQLEDEESAQHAAIALRATYSQALETFFAFVGAGVQCPGFVPGWILAYRPGDVQELVTRINSGASLPNRLFADTPTWAQLSAAVNPVSDDAPEHLRVLPKNFAKAWQRLSHEFCDRHRRLEFNSLKHGLRIHPGGFSMAISTDPEDAADRKWESLGGSKFGSRYYTREQIDGVNFQVKSGFVNWPPKDLVQRIGLLATSLRNLLRFLIWCDDHESAKELPYYRPNAPDAFEALWKDELRIGITSMSGLAEHTIVPESIEQVLMTKDEILETYKRPGDDAESPNAPQSGQDS